MTLKPYQKRIRRLLLMSPVILAMFAVIWSVILVIIYPSFGLADEMLVLFVCLLVLLLARARRGPRVGPGPPSHPLPVTGPVETSRGSQTPKEEPWTQSGRSQSSGRD
jgi:hypothetical protein